MDTFMIKLRAGVTLCCGAYAIAVLSRFVYLTLNNPVMAFWDSVMDVSEAVVFRFLPSIDSTWLSIVLNLVVVGLTAICCLWLVLWVRTTFWLTTSRYLYKELFGHREASFSQDIDKSILKSRLMSLIEVHGAHNLRVVLQAMEARCTYLNSVLDQFLVNKKEDVPSVSI